MAFTDPQSITISGVTTSLPRTSSDGPISDYTSADGLIRLRASHNPPSRGGRARRVLRLDHSKVSADPHLPAQNSKVSMSNYMVFDLPPVGYSNAEALAVYVGLKTLFSASSDALIVKLLGGES